MGGNWALACKPQNHQQTSHPQHNSAETCCRWKNNGDIFSEECEPPVQTPGIGRSYIGSGDKKAKTGRKMELSLTKEKAKWLERNARML